MLESSSTLKNPNNDIHIQAYFSQPKSGPTTCQGMDSNEATQQHMSGCLSHNAQNGNFTPEGKSLSAMSRFGENARLLCGPTWFCRAEHHQRAITELPGSDVKRSKLTMSSFFSERR